MARIYLSATEFINNRPYDLRVPSYYDPAQVENPIFIDEDPRSFVRTRLPIAHMVEMRATKVPFDIADDKDVLDILHHIDAYIEEVQHSAAISVPIKSYISKIILLRTDVYRIFLKCMKRHPDWQQAYDNQSGIMAIITKLYGAMGIDVPSTNTIKSLANAPNEYDMRPLSEKLATLKKGEVTFDV